MTARVVWSVDVNRYLDNPTYAARVDAFVYRWLPLCGPSGVRVLEAEDGERAIFAESFMTLDRSEFNRDPQTGQVVQATVGRPLPEGTQLP